VPGFAGAVVFLTLAGCGGPQYEYAEVEGTVTLAGKPLSGVEVTFYPDNEGPKQLPFANGKTNSLGKYTLTLPDGKAGALVGKSRVVVNWPVPERREDQKRAPPPGPMIPVAYTVASETPLLMEVKPGARQVINLMLTK
jgi:hypothetical protein